MYKILAYRVASGIYPYSIYTILEQRDSDYNWHPIGVHCDSINTADRLAKLYAEQANVKAYSLGGYELAD